MYLVDAKVLIYPEQAMGFVQKDDILIVLDETQLDFTIFVLPKHRHFKFGLFDISNSIWSKELQEKGNATGELSGNKEL